MFNKILLIRPENIYKYNNYPALNLILLGSALKASGYEVKILNCAFEKNPLEALIRELPGALLAGISLLTSEAPDAYRIMKFIKETSNVPVVVGGWHCTLFSEQMAQCKYVDYVVCGDGEEHIVNIADSLKKGVNPGSKVFAKKIIDMEKLVEPDYILDKDIERFITSYLTDKLSEVVLQPMRWLPYESSRGCPSQCTFCNNVVSQNTHYRKKSSGKVLDEIEHIVKKYKITHLKILDDNFFVDIERVKEICAGIIAKGLKITWDAECRCDYFNERMLDDQTLKLAKDSGLIQLTLGIESGSVHTLAIMKKGILPAQAEIAVKKCDEHGIIARSSFILEIPGEKIEDIKQTIRFINRLRKYRFFTCGVGTFRPYPKCELTQALLKNNLLKEPADFSEWTKQDIIDMYTSAEHIRPWQVNGKYSESAAYYLNMESAVRLGNYQIDNPFDRIKNRLFMNVAKVRNRSMCYEFPVEKKLYKAFLRNFYKNRQDREKTGAYPLTDKDK